jgi:hypothetical protein
MKKTYYLLEVEGGIEPIVRGHCQTNRDRDNAAKQIRRRQDEDDGLFWADVDKAGTLTVGAYVAGFFWAEPTERGNLE